MTYQQKNIPKYELVVLEKENPIANLKNLTEAGQWNTCFSMEYDGDDFYIFETNSRKLIDINKPYCVFMYDGTFVYQYETEEEFYEHYEGC